MLAKSASDTPRISGGKAGSTSILRPFFRRCRDSYFCWPYLAPFCVVSTRLRHPPLTKSGNKKKRAVSDAPEAWFLDCSFMYFSLHVYLKTLSTPVGQGRAKSEKSAAGFGIILGIKGWGCYGKRNGESDSCVSAE